MPSLNSAFTRMLCGAIVVLSTCHASAAVVWDESVNGDLSNNRLAPTSVNLSTGTNSVVATMGLGGDLDYLTIVVPAGDTLSGLTPASYTGDDGTSFIGIEGGTQITIPTNSFTAAGLLGWSHFGSDVGNIGTDILPSMGTNGFDSTGFTPPLPSGSYSFWIQQLSDVNITYQLDFKVSAAVPEPSTACLTVIGSLVVATIVSSRRSVQKTGKNS